MIAKGTLVKGPDISYDRMFIMPALFLGDT